jgi:hypothetical protein
MENGARFPLRGIENDKWIMENKGSETRGFQVWIASPLRGSQ